MNSRVRERRIVSSRRGGGRVRASTAVLALTVLLLAPGCAEVGDAGPPVDPPSPSATPTDSALARHLARCERGIEEWKQSAGQVDYPKRLVVEVDRPTTYNAAVDIGDVPLPPDDVIRVPQGEATSEPITVKCGLAARLVPVGDLEVEPAADSWVTQGFSRSGVAEWAWTVSATRTGDQQLRLELQPAQLGTGTPLAQGMQTAKLFTDVEVEGTFVDRASSWFQGQWPKVAGIAGILATATLLVLAWLGRLRNPWKKAPAGG